MERIPTKKVVYECKEQGCGKVFVLGMSQDLPESCATLVCPDCEKQTVRGRTFSASEQVELLDGPQPCHQIAACMGHYQTEDGKPRWNSDYPREQIKCCACGEVLTATQRS